MRRAMSQVLMDIMGLGGKNQNNDDDYARSRKKPVLFFKTVELFKIKFRQKCNGAVCAKKKTAKNFFLASGINGFG